MYPHFLQFTMPKVGQAAVAVLPPAALPPVVASLPAAALPRLRCR